MNRSEAEEILTMMRQLSIDDYLCMAILIATMGNNKVLADELKKNYPDVKARYTEMLKIGSEEDARRYAW